MSAHTPGPWTIDRVETFAWIMPREGKYAVAAALGNDADTAILAAAPDMLAACKQALAALQSESQLDRANAIKALRDVIAKVET